MVTMVSQLSFSIIIISILPSGPSGLEIAFAIIGGLVGVVIISLIFIISCLAVCLFFGLIPNFCFNRH